MATGSGLDPPNLKIKPNTRRAGTRAWASTLAQRLEQAQMTNIRVLG